MRPATVLILCSMLSLAGQPANANRDRAMVPYRQGLEHLRAEAWDNAASAFQQAIDIDSAFEMAHYGLGRARIPQKRYAEAIVSLTRCRDLFKSQVGRQFTTRHDAQRYRQDRINEIDELIRQYQQGPSSIRSQDALRQLEQQKRDIREQFDRGMNITLENAVPAYVSLALGSAFFRSEQFADAEREYRAAIASNPRIGEAHNNLAVLYMLTERLGDAEREIALAEKVGFTVHPQLKEDLKKRRQK
jgi:tetratricopeptide (TPR) repeat protein